MCPLTPPIERRSRAGSPDLLGPRLRPAEEALLLGIRGDRTPDQWQRLHQLLGADDTAWHRLWSAATLQQVQPLVARLAHEGPLSAAAPAAIRDAARAIRMQVLLRNMSLAAELKRIAALLQGRDIPVVPLKGTALTQRLYDSLDGRWCGDIDLLVPEPAHETALQTLVAAGYTPDPAISPGSEDHPFHGMPLARSASGTLFVVELHWKLSDPRFAAIDYPGLWARIEAGRDAAGDLRPLPREELLVFLALHFAKHHTGVLRLLADIDRLVRREGATLDWPYAIALAERWGVAALLYFVLGYAHALLGTPLPSWVLPALRPAAWRRSLVNLLAGTQAILRPPTSPAARYSRFGLAYCAMLSPLGRSLAAYRAYLASSVSEREPGGIPGAVATARGLAVGVGRTGLVVAGALAARTWSALGRDRAGVDLRA